MFTHVCRGLPTEASLVKSGAGACGRWRGRDARQGGAVASGLNALIVLAWDDFFTGGWDEADELSDEALRIAEELGYGLLAWPAKLVQP